MTPFVEDTALRLAYQDAEADTGAHVVDDYLREHFLAGELDLLAEAARLLSNRAYAIYLEKVRDETPAEA